MTPGDFYDRLNMIDARLYAIERTFSELNGRLIERCPAEGAKLRRMEKTLYCTLVVVAVLASERVVPMILSLL